MSFPWESVKADGQELVYFIIVVVFERKVFCVQVGHTPKSTI